MARYLTFAESAKLDSNIKSLPFEVLNAVFSTVLSCGWDFYFVWITQLIKGSDVWVLAVRRVCLGGFVRHNRLPPFNSLFGCN